jgi:MFS family permease/quinol monooxygenase YgiN
MIGLPRSGRNMAKRAKGAIQIKERQSRNDSDVSGSAWGPLREPIFRALWIASVASNVGSWMQDVGESWLMISLTKSPILVALVETAGSLPIFLLALPAGALADVVDRRRLLLTTQSWMGASAALMGALTLAGVVNPWLLLLLTFTLGLGVAMNGPAWQAIIPELAPRDELPAAVALGSVAMNVSRAIGPALGGLLVAAAGSGIVFLLNAVSFLGVIVVIYRWRQAPQKIPMPPEHVFGAMRAGLRYVSHAPELRAAIVRAGIFILCGSALWALLPLHARHTLGLGSFGYGVLLGCIGAGAVAGAAFLPKARRKASNNSLVVGASVLFASMLAVLAHARVPVVAGAAMIFAGVAWITITSSFNTVAQTSAPTWVRARALAFYLLVFMGGMAAGSAAWGAVATHVGVTKALTYAAWGLIAGLAASPRYKLVGDEELKLGPSAHWPEPVVVVEPRPEQGPVLVQIEYRIDPERASEFLHAVRELRRTRRRDGAVRWGLFRDPAEPGRFVESFVVESWAEHLRQHARATESDREIEERVQAFRIGGGEPVVTHLIYERVPS